jgi:glyoxylase-like metal-dependent hydrolase (beta-lactamase superfamily II)
MRALAAGIDYADLEFLGRADVIATAVVHDASGVALIDPGPTSCLPVLRRELQARGMTIADVRHVLLTHIHLDHAGATGTLVHENPAIEVVVHERGAAHLVDPAKLLESATRLYGAAMDRLWGEVRAVPATSVRVLSGGERVTAGGRTFEVAYSPGHASHHVSYFEPATGVAFVGDTAGIRRGPAMFVMPPTPPPDVDLESWRQSLDRITRWRPSTLFVTHFGPYSDAAAHVADLVDRLEQNSALARALVASDLDEAEKARQFVEALRRALRGVMPAADAEQYESAGNFEYNWLGLARYWRKKAG